jgi:rubredoxin
MERHPDTMTCPECAEEVEAAARVCRFCGYHFEGEQTTPVGALAPPPKTRRRWPWVTAALSGLLVLGLAGSSCDAVKRDNQPPPQETSDSSAPESAAGDQAGVERELERRMRRQLEGAIAKDARKQVREGVLGGPIKRAHCTLSNREPGGRGGYKCLAITGEGGDRAEGYEYQGTANAKNGETTWERSDSP